MIRNDDASQLPYFNQRKYCCVILRLFTLIVLQIKFTLVSDRNVLDSPMAQEKMSL